MTRGFILTGVLLLIITGCSRHRDSRNPPAHQKPSEGAQTAPALADPPASITKVASEPVTLDSTPLTRPSPFAAVHEADRQQAAAVATAPPRPKPSPDSPRKPLKPFVPKSDLAMVQNRERIAALPTPPPISAGSASPISSLGLARRACCVGRAVAEPAKPARIIRMLQKVPGLRRIRQTPEALEGFVAARPAHEITMVLPPEATAALTQGSMDLKATVDESGHVTRVEILAPRDEELVRLASYAAGTWPFVPAKLNDKTVPSEIILHFNFSGN